ncbi:hypothetical protein EHJ16_22595 [Cronobacter dublinensis]|nr:hypothetical protein [Cronobacter dublinensis]
MTHDVQRIHAEGVSCRLNILCRSGHPRCARCDISRCGRSGTRDVAGRLVSESDFNGELIYAWDALGNLTNMTLPGGQQLSCCNMAPATSVPSASVRSCPLNSPATVCTGK